MRLLRTAVYLALSFLCVAVLAPGAARAQDRSTWVQIEALPTLPRATDRATAWSSLFPDVAGFRLSSGWYALAIGPYERIEAQQRLDQLRGQNMIPDDSYLVESSRYGERFWTGAGSVPAGTAETGSGDEIAVIPLEDAPEEAEGSGDVAASGGPEAGPPGGDTAVVAVPPVLAIPDETLSEARANESYLSREERQEIQIALKHEGVYSSGIDGAFGPGTRAAMSAWQTSRGYEATGVLTSRQRQELVGGYRAMLSSLGLAEVRDNTAGIAVQLPTALVTKGDYQPPFAHYDSKGSSGVEVLLLSQSGDAVALAGLYDILQTLELVPTNGPRDLRDRGFTIEGRDGKIITHVEARLMPQGLIKGFMLVWPEGDEARRRLVLTAMQDSFTPLGESALATAAADASLTDVDLVSGLRVRRPDVSRTGVYVDGKGHVLTSADAVGSCARITVDGDVSARVVAQDAALGLALLAPDTALAPRRIAEFASAPPRLGAEIAVSGYAYDGRLGAAVITYGRLADLRGLDGSGEVYRLDVSVTPGEAGAPVLDSAGAVTGILLAAGASPSGGQGARQVLPESVVFAASAQRVSDWLAGKGVAPRRAEGAGDILPILLTEQARDMTVAVGCWQ